MVLVHFVHERNILQLKAVKGVKQELVDLNAPFHAAAVYKGQIIVGRSSVDTCCEDRVGVVLIPPALGSEITALRMAVCHIPLPPV